MYRDKKSQTLTFILLYPLILKNITLKDMENNICREHIVFN